MLELRIPKAEEPRTHRVAMRVGEPRKRERHLLRRGGA
jgi:hypothetical protein